MFIFRTVRLQRQLEADYVRKKRRSENRVSVLAVREGDHTHLDRGKPERALNVINWQNSNMFKTSPKPYFAL